MTDIQSLKTASRLLITRVGGLEAAASCCRVGKTSLAQYYDRDSDVCMPVDVALALERVAGEPLVSEAMLRMQGYHLAAPTEASDGEDLRQSVADFIGHAGATGAVFVHALIDGVIDASERATLTHMADTARAILARVEGALAAHDRPSASIDMLRRPAP